MEIKNKKIGIWGFGKVGKSAAQYFKQCGNVVEVMDSRELSAAEKQFLVSIDIRFFKKSPHEIHTFLDRNDFIFSSPGVDVSGYCENRGKFLTELGVIRQKFANPIIAITGTVGKTTVTSIISQILKSKNINSWTGGNIGKPMLDLLKQKNKFEYIKK